MEPQISAESAKKMAQQLITEGVKEFSPVGGLEQRAIEAVQAGRGKEALEIIAGVIIPYTETDVREVLVKNLRSQPRGEDGRKDESPAGTPEKQRYDEAEKVALACLQYLKGGQESPPKELIEAVVDYLAQNPAFSEVIFDTSQTSPSLRTEAEIIATNLLRQPEVRRKIYALFIEKLNPTNRLPSESVVNQLRQELLALSTQVIFRSETDILNEVSSINRQIQEARRVMESDPHYSDYVRIRLSLNIIEEAIEAIQEGRLHPNSNQWEAMLVRLRNFIELSNNDVNVESVLNGLISAKLGILRVLEGEQFKQIRDREKIIIALNGRLEELEKERRRVNSEENKSLLIEYRAKEQKLKEAEVLLTAERIKYGAEVVAIPKEAVRKYLEEALGKAGQIYKQQAVEEAKKKEKEGQNNLSSAIEKIGERLGRKRVINSGGETRFLPDKKKARRLLLLLMQPGGVEIFMREVFMQEVFKDENALKNALVRDYGLTDSESTAVMEKMGDPEFVRNTGIQLAKKVLADYLLAGGRLSRDDIIAMGNAEWVMNLIEDGMRIAGEKREQIEKLLGKDVLTKFDEIKQGKSTGEWLKANWWKFGLGIIGILLLLVLGAKNLTGV